MKIERMLLRRCVILEPGQSSKKLSDFVKVSS
jgi:hypothetical protein